MPDLTPVLRDAHDSEIQEKKKKITNIVAGNCKVKLFKKGKQSIFLYSYTERSKSIRLESLFKGIKIDLSC